MSIDEAGEASGLVGKKVADRYLVTSAGTAAGGRARYEAEDVDLGRRVTLDIVRTDPRSRPDLLRRAEALRSIQHAALAGVLAVGQLDDDVYIASERVVGTTLRALTAGGLLEQRRALAIVRQVLDAVAAVHEAGAIHGDIKPENITIAIEGRVDRVKLSSVALASAAAEPSSADPRYAAPETELGSVDARTDIYAVGAVLFELLTGHPPFVADDPKALRRLHAYAPLQTLKQRAPELSFNHALEELVAMALTKKRDGRFQSARDMIAVLDHAVQSIEELASPEPERPRRRPANDSLLLLAKDLIPASASAAAADAVVVPANVAREVPELPWWTRAFIGLRRALQRGRVFVREKLTRRQRRLLAAGVAVLAIGLVVVIVARSRSTAGVAVGDNQVAAGHERDAEHAAEDAGVAEQIDRVPSLMLDLEHATTCAQRRTAITQLAATRDRRALPALRKAKRHKCVERDAAVAIQQVTGASRQLPTRTNGAQ